MTLPNGLGVVSVMAAPSCCPGCDWPPPVQPDSGPSALSICAKDFVRYLAQSISLGIQQRVQRLLHATPDHAVEVALDPLIINRDDIAQWTRCSLSHGGSFLLSWLCLATSSSARFGAVSPIYLCERFCTLSPAVRGRLKRQTSSKAASRRALRLPTLRVEKTT